MKKLLFALLAGTAYVLAKRRRTDPWISTAADAAGDRPNDATLAHKVETELFRSEDVPKGHIDINAELGVVYLRGEVPEQSMLDDLVARARRIDGVARVESLLHLPGQDAPTKES